MEIFDQTYYGNGDFDFVRDQDTKDFLKSAHNAITLCELWNWMRIYEPPTNTGFIWSKTHELDRIQKQMRNDDINSFHSASSYALIMRQMQLIAKDGYQHFKIKYYSN